LHNQIGCLNHIVFVRWRGGVLPHVIDWRDWIVRIFQYVTKCRARSVGLEAMLRDTPTLVHRRQSAPVNEVELQAIMHDYLSACFPDFRLNPPIGGTIKNFKPDCGIASVSAAIKFKWFTLGTK